jgi:hypothetical protein
MRLDLRAKTRRNQFVFAFNNRMFKIGVVLYAFFCITSLAATAANPPVVLVEDGQPRATVVVPN